MPASSRTTSVLGPISVADTRQGASGAPSATCFAPAGAYQERACGSQRAPAAFASFFSLIGTSSQVRAFGSRLVSSCTSLARVSVLVSIWDRSAAAAAADGASPSTWPPPSIHAPDKARMAVVLPDPAGAIASWRRAPEVAISRTSDVWPALSVTPLATLSMRAISTADSSTASPSVRLAASTSRFSAAITLVDVNRSAPATE